MFLFFDTETTGIPRNYNAPCSDVNNWPRLVQLAWVLCNDEGNKLASFDCIIKPKDFEIPEGASKIHGITTEVAVNNGFDLRLALDTFVQAFKLSNTIVGHNIGFDEKIVGAELFRLSMPEIKSDIKRICTMKTSTEICKIPGPYGFKWPKLSELYKTLFSVDLEDAHSAAVDIAATVKCFFELKRLKNIKESA